MLNINNLKWKIKSKKQKKRNSLIRKLKKTNWQDIGNKKK